MYLKIEIKIEYRVKHVEWQSIFFRMLNENNKKQKSLFKF